MMPEPVLKNCTRYTIAYSSINPCMNVCVREDVRTVEGKDKSCQIHRLSEDASLPTAVVMVGSRVAEDSLPSTSDPGRTSPGHGSQESKSGCAKPRITAVEMVWGRRHPGPRFKTRNSARSRSSITLRKSEGLPFVPPIGTKSIGRGYEVLGTNVGRR